MDDDTKKLLEECNSGCKMAISSMEQVSEYVTDNKLQDIIDSYKKKHEELENESSKLLEPYGETEKKPGVVASAFSWVTTEMKMMINGDSGQVAKLMMDGCNMGIQSIGEKVNEYSDSDKESKDLAQKLIKIEEDFMKDMKEYL